MGHLINPIGFRVGWFSGWCDSWFSDFVYYPEFLHDLFRVRLFLNFFFSLTAFEKSSLTFSHFEFYHKYAFLALRVFYYDGALMEGMFAFQTDFRNSFLRRRFIRFKKKNLRFLGSRNGRFFLFLFYSFFRFSNFFKVKFLKRQQFRAKGPAKFRIFERRERRLVRFLRLRRRLKLKKSALNKAKAIAAAKKRGKAYVPVRKSRKRLFFSYRPMFHSKSRNLRFFKPRRWSRGRRPFYGSQGQPLGSRVHSAHSEEKSAFFKQQGVSRNYADAGSSKNRPFFGQNFGLKKEAKFSNSFASNQKARFSQFAANRKNFRKEYWQRAQVPLSPQEKALRRERLLERRRRRTVFKIFKGILSHCRLGRLGSYLKRIRRLFSPKFFFKAELKVFIIFIILFRRVWLLFKVFVARAVKFDFFKELFFTASFLFFYNAFSFRFLGSLVFSFLRLLGLHYVPLKVSIFLLSNDTVTAAFLSKFIGRKLVQGYRYREILSPIMHDLYKTSRNVKAPKFKLAANLQKQSFSVSYRNGVLKAFVLKFFYIYKRLYAKFFWLQRSWVNFYFYQFLVLFFQKVIKASTSFLGFSKKFMLQKHGFLFFFNYDNALFSNSLSFIFNELFFDFFNKAWGQSLFFYFIFDDLFSHSSVLFFGQS